MTNFWQLKQKNDPEIYSNINFCSFWNQDGPTLWMGWAVAAVGRS